MFIAALIIGFAGSLHCVGMCSPLAMTISNLNPSAIFNRLIYNGGRILMYGILGALVGTIGEVLPFSGFQNILSIGLGISLLIVAITGISNIHVPFLAKLFQRLAAELKKLFGKFLQRKNYGSVFVLGTLNGLLPCGLTFLALSYSLTLGSTLNGFYSMISFGLGTLPVMLGLTYFFQFLAKRYGVNFSRLTTVLVFVSGCLLIARVFIFHEAHPHYGNESVVEIILCR
jgi:uncharacterized protein